MFIFFFRGLQHLDRDGNWNDLSLRNCTCKQTSAEHTADNQDKFVTHNHDISHSLAAILASRTVITRQSPNSKNGLYRFKLKPGLCWHVNEIKSTVPVYKIEPKRNPAICNLRTRLTKVRHYLKASTTDDMRNIWKGQITRYQAQLAKVEAHALNTAK